MVTSESRGERTMKTFWLKRRMEDIRQELREGPPANGSADRPCGPR